MAYQDIAVDFVDRPRAQVTKDRAYTLRLKAYSDGTQVVVTSGTISVKRPGGAALPTAVSDAAITVDGSGNMSYELSAANAANLGANYQAEWTFTDGTTTWERIQLFDVVRFPLYNVVTQADLVLHHNDLTDVLFSGESTAQVYIEQAFQDVFQFIDAKGKRPWLVLSAEDLRRPIEHRALELFFFSRFKQEGDRWWLLMAHHRDAYATWMQMANFVYDGDDSGTADGTDNESGTSGEEGRNFQITWRV